ncbi:MAG TPA: hypothetical protein VFF14_08755 [Candidatus Deferrimicrobium sp.]|nr:hypothetical protein [Candidatus Deferrimicrobium sp.]
MMMLSLIAILFLIVFVIRTSNHSTAGIPNVTQPIEILRKRYALKDPNHMKDSNHMNGMMVSMSGMMGLGSK